MTLTERISKLLQSLSVGIPEREFCFQLAFLGVIISEPFYIFGRCGSGKSLLTKRLIATFRDPKVLKFGKRQKDFPEKLSGFDMIIFHGFNPLSELTKHNLQVAIQDREDIPLFISGDVRPETAMRQTGMADRITLSITLPESLTAPALCNLLQNQYEIENFTVDKELTISTEERRQWLTEIKQVSLSQDVLNIIGGLSEAADKNDIYISIRQWMSLTDLIKATAFFNGRHEANITDTFLLGTAVWGKTSTSRVLTQCYTEILNKQLLKDVPGAFEQDYDTEDLAYRIDIISRTSNNCYDTHTLNNQQCLYYRITISGEPVHLYVPLYRIETEEDFHPFNELNMIEKRVMCNYHGTSTCSISIDSAVKGVNAHRAGPVRAGTSVRFEEFAKLPTYIVKENDPEIIASKREQLANIAQEIREVSEKENQKLRACKAIYQALKASADNVFCDPKTLKNAQQVVKDKFDNTAAQLKKIKEIHTSLIQLNRKLNETIQKIKQAGNG